FLSAATNLVTGSLDTNGDSDVFVRDMTAGTTELISSNSAGTGTGNRGCSNAVISADGQFVGFGSFAGDLTPGGAPLATNAYVRDRAAATTTVISVNGATEAAGGGNQAAISADGRFVAFVSSSTSLTLGVADTNAHQDIYVRDMTTNATTLASLNYAGTNGGNGDSTNPGISADGRFVIFTSDATDLVVPGMDANGGPDVFVRDLIAGTTSLVSINIAGTGAGNLGSDGGVITPDGRFAAFDSSATNLVSVPDANGFNTDVFVRDLVAGTTELVSVNSTGTATANGVSSSPAVSSDGRFVAFQSQGTNLVTGVTDANGIDDIFVRDRTAGSTMLVSINSFGNATGNDSSSRPLISAEIGRAHV